MRFSIHIFLFIFIASCSNSNENKNQTSVSSSFYNIALKTIDGESITLSKIKETKASVFFFMSPECPICQSYSLTINEIIQQYKDNRITFYGVLPGTYYKKKQTQSYLTDYKMQFIPLLDPQILLAKNIHATVTPEAFVLDSLGKILYHGCIDNWFYSVGKHRSVITEYYLKDVLEKVINNKPVDVHNTTPIGCFIE